MNFVSRIELHDLNDTELSALFGLISRELSQTRTGSLAWKGAMLSLENIRHEQAKRLVLTRPKPKAPSL